MSLKAKAKKAMTTSDASVSAYKIRQEYLSKIESENKAPPPIKMGQLYSTSRKGTLKGTPLSRQ